VIVMNVGRVSIPANTATQIVPARTGRKELRVVGVGGSSTSDVGIGPDNSITTTTNFLPPTGQFVANDFEGAVFGICNQARNVQFFETYDDGM
jgi:hypothetical protein